MRSCSGTKGRSADTGVKITGDGGRIGNSRGDRVGNILYCEMEQFLGIGDSLVRE